MQCPQHQVNSEQYRVRTVCAVGLVSSFPRCHINMMQLSSVRVLFSLASSSSSESQTAVLRICIQVSQLCPGWASPRYNGVHNFAVLVVSGGFRFSLCRQLYPTTAVLVHNCLCHTMNNLAEMLLTIPLDEVLLPAGSTM